MSHLTPDESRKLTKRLRFRQAEVMTSKFVWSMVSPIDINVYENMKELAETIETDIIKNKCQQEDQQTITNKH